MTKEDIEILQSDLQQSGKSVKTYLHETGISYSTYNYWRKKMSSASETEKKPELAPIRFTRPPTPSLAEVVPSGVTVLFPKGLRVHFGVVRRGIILPKFQTTAWLTSDKKCVPLRQKEEKRNGKNKQVDGSLQG